MFASIFFLCLLPLVVAWIDLTRNDYHRLSGGVLVFVVLPTALANLALFRGYGLIGPAFFGIMSSLIVTLMVILISLWGLNPTVWALFFWPKRSPDERPTPNRSRTAKTAVQKYGEQLQEHLRDAS